MANQATSRADDLMVGAGALFFARSDDPNGLHHLGNVSEFNITTDVTTVEKNSAMDKDRELLASVVTAVNPTGSLTMNEYNPYNLALGLYGREGVLSQAAVTLSNTPYTIVSVPGVIELMDANGNRYHDVRNITISRGTATSAACEFTSASNPGAQTITTTTLNNDTISDSAGGSIVVDLGTASSATPLQLLFQIRNVGTTAGDMDGMEVDFRDTDGSIQTVTFTTASQTTYDFNSVSGIVLHFNIGTGNYSPGVGWGVVSYTPSANDYEDGKDYIITDQMSRAGLIQIPSGSSINVGDVVMINAQVPAGDYVTVSGGDAGEIQGKLLFVGDPNIGGQYNIEGWKVKVTPDGDLTGLIGEDFGEFTLQVRFLSDKQNHPKCPYYRATHIGRADGSTNSANKYNPEY